MIKPGDQDSKQKKKDFSAGTASPRDPSAISEGPDTL
jgi:hypothetical protein